MVADVSVIGGPAVQRIRLSDEVDQVKWNSHDSQRDSHDSQRDSQMVKEINEVITERAFSFRSEQQQRNA